MFEPFTDPDPFPFRPDHPDFWRLSDLVVQLTSQAEEKGRRLDDLIAPVIDPKSLAYTAFQRATRAFKVTTRKQLWERQSEVLLLATLYHEAFILGSRYERNREADDWSRLHDDQPGG
jgi:hypothetical protein